VLKVLLDDLTQLPVDHQLGRLRAARALVGQRMRGRRPVAAATIGVASQLPADRRWRALQPTRDRAHRLAPGTRQRDLLALGEGHTPAREVAATAWAHPAGRAHPLQPTPAMRPGHRRGVGEKLTTRERRPEPLVNLGHHPRLEDRHVSHTPVVASWGGPSSDAPRTRSSSSPFALRARARRRPCPRSNPGRSTPAQREPGQKLIDRGVAITAGTQGSACGIHRREEP